MSTDIVTILDDSAPLTVTTKRQISGNKFDLSPETTLLKRNRRPIERRYAKHITEQNRRLYRASCATAARLINLFVYLNHMAIADRRSPTGFLARCSAQTSPLFIVE